ncbi:MAG: barstar family protein [Chitinophagales bacterium]|nr:barstar family protein [Chitinophagales bacterium]
MTQDVLFFIYSDEKNLPATSSSSLHIELDGGQFPTINKLYVKLNKELLFGGDFGNNLDALFDSMTDLSWLKEKKFRLIFKNSEFLLKDEDDDTIFDFLNTLNDIGISINDEPMFSEQSRSMKFYFDSNSRIEQLLDDAYLIWETI